MSTFPQDEMHFMPMKNESTIYLWIEEERTKGVVLSDVLLRRKLKDKMPNEFKIVV